MQSFFLGFQTFSNLCLIQKFSFFLCYVCPVLRTNNSMQRKCLNTFLLEKACSNSPFESTSSVMPEHAERWQTRRVAYLRTVRFSLCRTEDCSASPGGEVLPTGPGSVARGIHTVKSLTDRSRRERAPLALCSTCVSLGAWSGPSAQRSSPVSMSKLGPECYSWKHCWG